jgi:hypothetical protein
MAFLRYSRDKRGYEHVYLIQPVGRRGQSPARVLYWFRTPPNIRVGREPFDESARRALEEEHRNIVFNWPRLLATPKPPPEKETWRERRRAERAARRAAAETEAEPPSAEAAAGEPAGQAAGERPIGEASEATAAGAAGQPRPRRRRRHRRKAWAATKPPDPGSPPSGE